MGPNGPIGSFTSALGVGYLPFTFSGLVLASVVYSLPFVVQPIQNTFESIGDKPLEMAAVLRAGPIDRFFTVVLPLAIPGFVTGAVLGFAHTLGEFGVVLMIGGNIPGGGSHPLHQLVRRPAGVLVPGVVDPVWIQAR